MGVIDFIRKISTGTGVCKNCHGHGVLYDLDGGDEITCPACNGWGDVDLCQGPEDEENP